MERERQPTLQEGPSRWTNKMRNSSSGVNHHRLAKKKKNIEETMAELKKQKPIKIDS